MAAVNDTSLKIIRRHVPDDHECLFTAISYLAEGPNVAGAGKRLRKLCADKILSDPDTYSEAVLGRPNAEYATWIQNHFNWGGENEIGILAAHFDLEITVVMMEYGFCMPYTFGNKHKVYLLYTGQHYDPLVAAVDEASSTDGETRYFPVGDTSMDASALECAAEHQRIKEVKASQRTVKKIKCDGCGAILDDADAFQLHCGEVEHDDDFAWTCTDVEVVEEGGDPTPEGRIDLSSPDVHCFYNLEDEAFSNLHASPMEVEGVVYRSVFQYVIAKKFEGMEGGLQAKIIAAATLQEARALDSEGFGNERPDWDGVREVVLLDGLMAKFTQNSELAAELIGTGTKTIVMVDAADKWGGMSAEGGIPTGKNKVGEALMKARAELAPAPDITSMAS